MYIFFYISDASHKTVISTTIPVGDIPDSSVNLIPTDRSKGSLSATIGISSASRDMDKFLKPDLSKSIHESWEPGHSQAQDIPGSMSRSAEDAEKSRPRSMSPLSPLSTSPPVSTAMLQEVKLRSRSSVKKPANDILTKDTSQNNELSKAFDRAKRISRKFDEAGEPDKHEVKIVEKTKDVKQDTDVKPVVKEVKPHIEVNKPSETVVKPGVTISSDKSALSNLPTSPTSSGVSFVLKKEPLRPASKTNVTTVTSFGENVETSSIVTTGSNDNNKDLDKKTDDKSVDVKVQNNDSNVNTKLPATDSVHESPNKLASPKEDFRLRRQVRSKTLPVSKEAIEKAEETVQSSANRKSVDYDNVSSLRSTAKAADIVSSRTMAEKRSSWAPASMASSSVDSRPEWVIRAQNKEKKIEEDKTGRPKEIKIEPKEIKIEPKEQQKSPDKSPTEKPADSPIAAQSVAKVGSQPQVVKQDKPVSAKPVTESTGFSLGSARVQFGKTTPASTSTTANKPAVVTASEQKPVTSLLTKPLTSNVSKFTTSSGKDTQDASKSVLTGYRKPSVPSTAGDKPVIQSVKPPVNVTSKPAISSEKPAIHSVKPATPATTTTAKFGGVSKTSETPASRPVFQKQSSTESNKPAPLSVRTAGTNSKTNIVKPDTKDTPKIQTSSVTKGVSGQGNNENSQSNIVSPTRGSLYGKPKPFGSDSSSGSDTTRKFGSSIGSNGKKSNEMKIEIIDKDKTAPAKTEQVSESLCALYETY